MACRAELVFIPGPGVGHLMSTVEVAKRLVNRDEGLSVAVLVMMLSDNSALKGIMDSLSASSSTGRIRFIQLPEPESRTASGSNAFLNYLNSIESYKPSVRDFVLGLAESDPVSDSPRLAGLVIDMFCVTMIDVANEFGVPSYVYYTSSATFLGAMFHLQALQDVHQHQQDISELIKSNATIDYPGFANPLPVRLLPSEMVYKDVSSVFLGLAKRFKETKGIMVNTFEEVDSRAIKYVFDDKLPTLYPVGPILNLKDEAEDAESNNILKWLDGQPLATVVFLCFGSMGSCRENQVRQIARALENSGHRFLWSLRRPPPAGKFGSPSNYDNPEEVLPGGFLDRTAGRGKVIGWAPQAQVLAHPAVGGFVSHCGWNSILESIWFGVPMAAWPMYAEQHFNAFALVEDLGVAVEISMEYRRDYLTGTEVMVPAVEIENGIRRLMGTEGEEMREKVKQMSESGRKASMEGGSAHLSLGRFIKDAYSNICRR